MNIFALDEDPRKCASSHSDKHVVKMILESAQMICTTHHLHHNKFISYTIPYKMTHKNHPCTKWVRESLANYEWLTHLISHLNAEYRERYGKDVNHKSFDAVKHLPDPDLPNIAMTPFALAMPEPFKYLYDDPVQCYRAYYAIDKYKLLNYSHKGDHPHWLDSYKEDRDMIGRLVMLGYKST